MENYTTNNSAKPKPTLIFFETTVACDYRCRHCRASTQSDPSPDQLSNDQLMKALDGIKKFGRPYPTVIFTGGNLLLRDGIRDIIRHAHDLGIPFSLSPSGSSLLTPDFLNFSLENSVRSYSLSIDGADGKTHDWIRRNPGSHSLTVSLIREIHELGIPVQVNTTVMKKNVKELPLIAKLLKDLGVKVWEVFFLIKTGRGLYEKDLTAQEIEDVNLWLATMEDYGITVRPVESPMFRRVRKQRAEGVVPESGPLYQKLNSMTVKLFGEPHHRSREPLKGNPRPEFGMLFVSQNGNIYPDGFLPMPRGNVKTDGLADVYWNDKVVHELRLKDNLKGKCGYCDFRKICGGSRARAFSAYHDPYAEDPGCIYMPLVPQSFGAGD